MQLTFKDLKQNIKTLDNIKLSETIEELSFKVKELFNFPDGVRLIYCGRILEKTKLVSEYFQENSSGFVVCMPEKSSVKKENNNTVHTPTNIPPPPSSINTTIVPPPPSPINTPIVPPPPSPINTPPNRANNNRYTIEEVRAFLLLYSQFMRSSPDVFHTFCTNIRDYETFLLSPEFIETILEPMMSVTTNLVDAINTRTNIDISVPVVANLNRRSNTNQANLLTNTTNTTNQANDNLFAPLPQRNIPVVNNINDELTETDYENIRDLTNLGFTTEMATQAYLMSGKNKEMAAAVLFELMQ